MSASAKTVIFISYAHADEPDRPADGEVQWLSFVRRFLQPAVKDGIFDLWVDRKMLGGADWDPEIEEKLRACDMFILLVSANSMASHYIVDKEIAIIRARQASGDDVHFYPLLLTPTPAAGLNKVLDKNLRPRDAKPFSGFSHHDRLQHMTEAADEIAEIAVQIATRKAAAAPAAPPVRLTHVHDVHVGGLPETAYERLVGRDAELAQLDAAWADRTVNVISLVAEGGAGKSALVNEWLIRLQADDYRGAEAVLGWSFYSQGTKERATSAEEFLDWALARLGIRLATTSMSAKAEAIAEAVMRRRVLLVLDGIEPLQHGPGPQLGQLKDQGLRALLRRLAAAPSGSAHGLVVLTSRLAVADIARWRDSAAPVVDVERLSDAAGAALLRDNGVWGTDREREATAHDFAGHPLALGLLASFLFETQSGDARRRDHIRAWTEDADNPRHDHARRVMESYEKEWLAEQPVLHAIMHLVGLFDRPASGDCLNALRAEPAIARLTDSIVALNDDEWRRAVARLRAARLLAPPDPVSPDVLDAHPLVREWFGERLKQTDAAAWQMAHGRLYEHLRDTTREGPTPTLHALAPLYQAIAHGCCAGRRQEVLDDVYVNRVCRRETDGDIEFYSRKKLGAVGSDLAALSWFFEEVFTTPAADLHARARYWVLGEAAFRLRTLGRLAEALPAERASLRMAEEASDWSNAAIGAINLNEAELLVGDVTAAVATAEKAVVYAIRNKDEFQILVGQTVHANALLAAGRRVDAENLFAEAERRQCQQQPGHPLLYSVRGYQYCDLLLSKADWITVLERASKTLEWIKSHNWLLDIALDMLNLGRTNLGLALNSVRTPVRSARDDTRAASDQFDDAVDHLRAAGQKPYLTSGLLAHAAFYRSVGDWDGAARDLDEVEEIAGPGPMRLFLCDMALERTRLALARGEAFAPLNSFCDKAPPMPIPPGEAARKSLNEEAAKQIVIAADYIETCGYHRRDVELAELRAVLRGERAFADLPPRV